MPKPNSFYRFETTWNAGFYPDNQIVSNILNEVYTGLSVYLPTIAVVGVTQLDVLRVNLKSFVKIYNETPYFGELTFQINYLTATDYVIIIYNKSLIATDNTQSVIINGTNDINGIIDSAPIISPFFVGAYFGSFDASPIPVESQVANSLNIANQYGSALFPITYSYNHTTKIAKSGLARGKNWTINSNGDPTRLPVNTLPLQNARRFTLPQLSADERFIISFLENIIQSSLNDDNYLSIQSTFNSFVIPNGWAKDFTYDSASYDRIQINVINTTSYNVYTIVGRLDGDWLWQRFVKIGGYAGSYDFIANYADTTALPYVPLASASYLYFGEYYDFEFCDFTESCYISPEFYQMPVIQGDVLKFNVDISSGNTTGLDSVSVGLFTENGQFIQKIGTATKEIVCFNQMYASTTIPAVESGCYRLGLYQEPIETCDLEFYWLTSSTTYLETINSAPLNYLCFGIYDITNSAFVNNYGLIIPPEGLTPTEIVNFANTIDGMFAFYSETENYFTFTWNKTVDCDASYTMRSYIGDIDLNIIDGIWSSITQECICQTQYYLYSLSNIINADSADCFSTILEFWGANNSIAQGFEYDNNWKQRIRLGINGGGAKPIIEESLYRQSNGVHKRPQNKQDLSLDLHTDFIDEPTQLALVDATRHPYLVWNNKPIFVKGEIEVATTQDFTTQSSFETLAQVKFSALVQGFQPKNSTCINC